MSIPVRQREYLIRTGNTDEIITKNVDSCVVLVGRHVEKRIVFMTHVDTAIAAQGLPRLFEDLRRVAGSLDGFELHTAGGYPPKFNYFFIVLAAIAAIGMVLTPMAFWALIVCAAIPVFYGSTWLAVRRQVRRSFPSPASNLGWTPLPIGRLAVSASWASKPAVDSDDKNPTEKVKFAPTHPWNLCLVKSPHCATHQRSD